MKAVIGFVLSIVCTNAFAVPTISEGEFRMVEYYGFSDVNGVEVSISGDSAVRLFNRMDNSLLQLIPASKEIPNDKPILKKTGTDIECKQVYGDVSTTFCSLRFSDVTTGQLK